MDTQIPWWRSKTIWVGLAQALVGVLVGLGYMTEAEGADASNWLQQILGVVVAGLGAATVWGRASARSEIKPEVLPPAAPPAPPPGMQP